MNTTRNGKIARLPKAVREELNQRLDDGEEGSKLVAWLNTLPEADIALPIREQNLSEWRQGGMGPGGAGFAVVCGCLRLKKLFL